MPESQRRYNSEIGKFFNEADEPLVHEVSEKVLLLLRFWLTYAQTQPLKIEDPDTLLKTVKMCLRGYRSIDIAERLSQFGIDGTKEFIDRLYVKVRRLILLILRDQYYVLGLVERNFELKEEERRVFNIYKRFSKLPGKINRLSLSNPRFSELAIYNPFYIDFLTLFSSGINVATALENDGLNLTQAKRFAISESIISAVVRVISQKLSIKKSKPGLYFQCFLH